MPGSKNPHYGRWSGADRIEGQLNNWEPIKETVRDRAIRTWDESGPWHLAAPPLIRVDIATGELQVYCRLPHEEKVG